MPRKIFARHAPGLTLLLCAALCASQATAQSVVEAKFVLGDIQTRLSGTFDNEPQRYLDAAFGESEDGPHRWQHREIQTVDLPSIAPLVLHGVITQPSDLNQPAQHWLYAFDIDESMKAVRMRRFVVDVLDASGTAPADLAAGATEVDADCPVWWRQGPGDTVYGSMSDTWCATRDKPARQVRADWVLSDGELTILQAARDQATQALTSGRRDHVPTRFTRARRYECFINIRHTDGSGSTLINPFSMHDAGGRYTLQTDETTPRQFEITLRRSMWPSRSGRNFVPLLAMWVYEQGKPDDAVAAVWSAADSGRVGWDFGSFGGGRCKIP